MAKKKKNGVHLYKESNNFCILVLKENTKYNTHNQFSISQ